MTRAVARASDNSAAAKRAEASAAFVRGAITGHLRRMGLSVITPESPRGALVVLDGGVRVVVTVKAAKVNP